LPTTRNEKRMKILKKLRSTFKFQRKYGVVDNLAFINNTSKNVKNPYRIKAKKPLKTLKFGINSVLLNNSISKVLSFNLWKYCFRPSHMHDRYFANIVKTNDSQITRHLKSLKRIKTCLLLDKNNNAHIKKEMINVKKF